MWTTLLLYVLLTVIAVAVLFALVVFVLPRGEQIAPPVRDSAGWQRLPERAITPEDVVAVRLPVALRGYRFAETDLLLDRLTEELRLRDEEIARLRHGSGGIGVVRSYGTPAPVHLQKLPDAADPAAAPVPQPLPDEVYEVHDSGHER